MTVSPTDHSALRPSRVPELLELSRRTTEPLLRAVVAGLTSPADRVASYHFGWTDREGRLTTGGGGKMLRPALAYLSAGAVGALPGAGAPGGAAVELVHNFSLLHDDFMDGDRERRHRETAWVVFGPALAVLTGDALFARAPGLLLDETSGHASRTDRARAAQRLAEATTALVNGQTGDLSFESRDHVTPQECLDMVAGKTGALLACASSVGAVLAGADDGVADALADFGLQLGLAFQAADDLLGIWGDPAATGKPARSDLRRRKKSLPVCAALAEGGRASRELASRYLPAPAGEEQEAEDLFLERCAYLIEEAGGRDWTRRESARRIRRAMEALDRIALPRDIREGFTAFATFVVERRG
ncbi:polyprenyl synthetase family protein [Streptomyces sp. NPDC005805]|uniref:polyprenyl synthetase family protein n=1 Tax=Streptomyces sp. NPDC005805 TaxID=3157068 RepID=UPI0033C69F43